MRILCLIGLVLSGFLPVIAAKADGTDNSSKKSVLGVPRGGAPDSYSGDAYAYGDTNPSPYLGTPDYNPPDRNTPHYSGYINGAEDYSSSGSYPDSESPATVAPPDNYYYCYPDYYGYDFPDDYAYRDQNAYAYNSEAFPYYCYPSYYPIYSDAYGYGYPDYYPSYGAYSFNGYPCYYPGFFAPFFSFWCDDFFFFNHNRFDHDRFDHNHFDHNHFDHNHFNNHNDHFNDHHAHWDNWFRNHSNWAGWRGGNQVHNGQNLAARSFGNGFGRTSGNLSNVPGSRASVNPPRTSVPRSSFGTNSRAFSSPGFVGPPSRSFNGGGSSRSFSSPGSARSFGAPSRSFGGASPSIGAPRSFGGGNMGGARSFGGGNMGGARSFGGGNMGGAHSFGGGGHGGGGMGGGGGHGGGGGGHR